MRDFQIFNNKVVIVYAGALATSAARGGATLQAIMRARRWKQTNTVMEYIEASEQFQDKSRVSY